jgi:glyoxylate/succinic semialdehyde reductase
MHVDAPSTEGGGTLVNPVGFIGLGIMGTGMARNLFRAGHSLIVWNRTQRTAENFAKELQSQYERENPNDPAGQPRIRVADSPRAVAAACNVVYSMLSVPAAATSVHLDPENGTVLGLGPQKMLVECSTLDVSTMERINEAAHRRGALFLEAPVSGSKVPAQTGTLIFLCSGDRAAYERIASNGLNVMGKAAFFLGEQCGAGTRMKIVVNMIMGSMIVALAEGASLAESCGLSTETLNEILKLGAMNNALFSMKLPNMVSGQYEAHFPLKHQQKDLRFAVSLGDEMEQWLPLAAIANEVFKAAQSSGYGDCDFSAVVEALRIKRGQRPE